MTGRKNAQDAAGINSGVDTCPSVAEPLLTPSYSPSRARFVSDDNDYHSNARTDAMLTFENGTARSTVSRLPLGPGPLVLFDHLPEGFIAYAVPDRSCEPLIKRGEIAIVDVTDRDPVKGALYLIRYVRTDGRARVCLVENHMRPARICTDEGAIVELPSCNFISHNRPRSVDQWPSWSQEFGTPVPMADGPYPIGPGMSLKPFRNLVGRVVGILASTIAERDQRGSRSVA